MRRRSCGNRDVATRPFFVPGRCLGELDVVLDSPQSLDISSRGTTSQGPAGASAAFVVNSFLSEL